MKTSEKIDEIANEIGELLGKNRIPAPNAHVIQQIRFLASQLSAIDTYAAGKAYDIFDKAEIFYSQRKHWKYQGGTDKLYVDMTFDLLNRIKQQAETRRNSGD